MKKTYIKPSVEVVEIDTTSILAGSFINGTDQQDINIDVEEELEGSNVIVF